MGFETVSHAYLSLAIPLQRLLEEAQRRRLVALLCDVTFEDLTFVIDSSPQVTRLAINLYEQLIDMPAPVSKAFHPTYPLPLNNCGEHRTKPVPPVPHGFVTNVYASLSQQIFHVPKAQWKADIHHHNQADNLRR